MKFLSSQELWKDALSLPEYIYKVVTRKYVEMKSLGLPVTEKILFDELMKLEEFKSIVTWKTLPEVKRLFEEEKKRRKDKAP